MNTAFLIGWRYFKTKRKEKFTFLISAFSVLGIAIGVMALILVIGVMNGFDKELRDKIIGNFSHVIILGYDGIEQKDYPFIEAKASSLKHVNAVSGYAQGQVFVNEGRVIFAADLKGIDVAKETKVTKIEQYLISGSLADLASDTAIIGKELSLYLGAGVGSVLNIYSAQGQKRALKIIGIFGSGIYDYDFRTLLVNLKTGQDILGLSGKLSGVSLKLDDIYSAQKVRDELAETLGVQYIVKTWMQLNENFFAALKLEKVTMFIILTLIVLVASFNIASTLIVMVVDKTKDIGILKTIGATSGKIKKIFIYEGLLIGAIGTFLGSFLGIGMCYLLKKYQFIKLPSVYSLEKLPVSIVFWPDIALIIFAALAITFISTVYPAIKAGKLKPVEALRYE